MLCILNLWKKFNNLLRLILINFAKRKKVVLLNNNKTSNSKINPAFHLCCKGGELVRKFMKKAINWNLYPAIFNWIKNAKEKRKTGGQIMWIDWGNIFSLFQRNSNDFLKKSNNYYSKKVFFSPLIIIIIINT